MPKLIRPSDKRKQQQVMLQLIEEFEVYTLVISVSIREIQYFFTLQQYLQAKFVAPKSTTIGPTPKTKKIKTGRKKSPAKERSDDLSFILRQFSPSKVCI